MSLSAPAVIVGIYYTTLMASLAAAPNVQPLIESIYELRDRPEINFVTNKDTHFDTFISVYYTQTVFLFYTAQMRCSVYRNRSYN